MVRKRKQKYTLEIVFGALVLVILLAIFIPSIFNKTDSDRSPTAVDIQREGVDVPIESSDPVLGNEEAPVTFVEFIDYQCPTCKKSAEETLTKLKEEYVEQGEVRYVVKDFPLVNLHPNAFQAAVAVRAAGEQGKYWEMHDLVFKHQDEWAELSDEQFKEALTAYAEDIGLDVEQFTRDLENEELAQQVAENRQLGEELGIRYTPTAIVNGKMYDEVITPNQLKSVIEEAKE